MQIANQGTKELDDELAVFLRHLAPKLEADHDIYCFFKCTRGPVMKVRRGERYQTQTRDLELVAVAIFSGNVEAAQVALIDCLSVTEVIVHDAEDLEHIAAHVDPLMTGNATILFE